MWFIIQIRIKFRSVLRKKTFFSPRLNCLVVGSCRSTFGTVQSTCLRGQNSDLLSINTLNICRILKEDNLRHVIKCRKMKLLKPFWYWKLMIINANRERIETFPRMLPEVHICCSLISHVLQTAFFPLPPTLWMHVVSRIKGLTVHGKWINSYHS